MKSGDLIVIGSTSLESPFALLGDVKSSVYSHTRLHGQFLTDADCRGSKGATTSSFAESNLHAVLEEHGPTVTVTI